MRWWVLGGCVALSACVVLGRPRPAIVEAGADVQCTETYWLSAGDAALALSLIPLSIRVSNENARLLEEAHARGEYDAQDGLAIMMPYAYAAVIGGALIAASVGSLQRTRECRRVLAWLAVTERPPDAGQPGRACVPVFGGGGHCAAGYHCQQGTCVPAPAPPPSTVAVETWSKQVCAAQMGALSAPMPDREWRERWDQLTPACQARLRDSCAAPIDEWRQASPEERARLEADIRPACLRLAALGEN